MQDILAISITIMAAFFLMRRGWRHFIRGAVGRCSSCASCRVSGTKPSLELVTLAQFKLDR
jgi:hypothetical protein